MGKRLVKSALLALALTGLLAASVPAAAQDITYAADGGRTMTMHAPDDWLSDNKAGEPLNLYAGDHSASVTLSIISGESAAEDDIAKLIMGQLNAGTPSKDDGTAPIAGLQGYVYRGGVMNSHNVHANLKLIIAKLDANTVLLCMESFTDNLEPDQQSALDGVIASISLSPAR